MPLTVQEFFKNWSVMVAIVAILTGIGIRWNLAEATIETHTIEIKENKILDAQQTQILDRLTSLREQDQTIETTQKDTRNKLCRELRNSGVIKKGECPPLE